MQHTTKLIAYLANRVKATLHIKYKAHNYQNLTTNNLKERNVIIKNNRKKYQPKFWDRLLYTVNLFYSQVNFIRNEIERMNNDQRIKQQTLPNDSDEI